MNEISQYSDHNCIVYNLLQCFQLWRVVDIELLHEQWRRHVSLTQCRLFWHGVQIESTILCTDDKNFQLPVIAGGAVQQVIDTAVIFRALTYSILAAFWRVIQSFLTLSLNRWVFLTLIWMFVNSPVFWTAYGRQTENANMHAQFKSHPWIQSIYHPRYILAGWKSVVSLDK